MLFTIENEWVPVIPKKPEPKKLFIPASTTNESSAIMPLSTISEQPPVQHTQTVFPSVTEVQ